MIPLIEILIDARICFGDGGPGNGVWPGGTVERAVLNKVTLRRGRGMIMFNCCTISTGIGVLQRFISNSKPFFPLIACSLEVIGRNM